MSRDSHKQAPTVIAAGLIIAASVWVAAASQQAAETKQFDEASIRPCDPDALPPVDPGARGGGPNSFQMTPGRLHAQCMTLATMIRTAYGYGPVDLDFLNPGGRGRGLNFNNVYGLGVEDGRRVKGGPDWVRSDRYSIDAVADDAADAASMSRSMLRALLEKRFLLAAHVEQEQIPAFNLTVAPGGLKMKPAAPGSCEPQPPITPGQPVILRRVPLDEVRRGAKPTCGGGMEPHGPNMVFVAGESTLDAFARGLSGQLGGVQVIDKTGITDRFNFIMEFVRDKDTPGLTQIPATEPSAPVTPGQNIFTALQDQLGLTLEPAKGSRDVVVVDSVQRPSGT